MLVETLIAGGYVREEPLFGPGQFSVRGGIVDIWSPDAEIPARLEFFGDNVESIRTFDPDTQLSMGQLNELSIAPMREARLRLRTSRTGHSLRANAFGMTDFLAICATAQILPTMVNRFPGGSFCCHW
jgi:transcription-repair coupling factor (superfamily II helicase)